MNIALIGMSGTGKSYWSKQFEQAGFISFCCDEMIENYLRGELSDLGYSGIADVARWMGAPYQLFYKDRQARYLQCEARAVSDIISTVQQSKEKNYVIDTTGSFIYLQESLIFSLRTVSTMVYLDTPESVQKEMFELYMADPKPVIWGDCFRLEAGQSVSQALQICYPRLLTYRIERYRRYAHIVLPYEFYRGGKIDVQDFLQEILSKISCTTSV